MARYSFLKEKLPKLEHCNVYLKNSLSKLIIMIILEHIYSTLGKLSSASVHVRILPVHKIFHKFQNTQITELPTKDKTVKTT